MPNRRLEGLMDRDELDWDDPRHREIYLREHVNKGSRAFADDDDEELPLDPDDAALPASC